jgi:hypothetical protein
MLGGFDHLSDKDIEGSKDFMKSALNFDSERKEGKICLGKQKMNQNKFLF